MKDRRRILFLILVMACVSLAVVGLTLYLLYDAAFRQQKLRLTETAESQARLIEAVARFDSVHSQQARPGGWAAATLDQVLEAHDRYQSPRDAGEFFLVRRQDESMIEVLHRFSGKDHFETIPIRDLRAELLERPLEGQSGVAVGTDSRGEMVLAAYEPLQLLGCGLVVQVELSEVRRPFVRAGLIASLATLVLVVIGAGIVLRVSNPLLTRLRMSESRFRGMFETAADAIVTVDDEGTIVMVNPACERTFGYTLRELVGRNVSCLMPEPYRSEHGGHIARYLRTGTKRIIGTSGREAEARRKDGVVFPVELSVSEVRLGKRRLFTGILRDVTERKKALEALEIRDQAIASSVTAIAIGDLEGRISYVNRAFLVMWGYDDEEEVVGRSSTELTSEPDKVGEIMEAVRTRGDWTGESVARRKDGTDFQVVLTATMVRDAAGRPLHMMATFIDVTEHKLAERRLLEQESLAKLGEVVAIVAHEVKNPLAGIIGAGRMLGRSLPEGSTEREIAEELASRAERLSESVKEILAYSGPQMPVIRPVPVDLLLEAALSLVSEDPLFKDVELSTSTPHVEIACDEEMLKPVLLNLLMNAAEAMEGRGHIDIVVDDGSTTGGYCRIRLRDTGPGIPPDKRHRIFEPFFTTKGAGTGLGLPIAKRVVELHGGRISVACPVGGGTEVTVELPCHSCAAEAVRGGVS